MNLKVEQHRQMWKKLFPSTKEKCTPRIVKPKPLPAYVQERLAICSVCEHAKGGKCLIVEAKNPGKSVITSGVLRPELSCPDDPSRWPAVSSGKNVIPATAPSVPQIGAISPEPR